MRKATLRFSCRSRWALKLSEYLPSQEFIEKNTSLRKILEFIALGRIAEATPTDSARSSIAYGLKTGFLRWPISDLCRLPEQVTALRRDLPEVDTQSDFSSDRSIRKYCEKVWQVRPVMAPSGSTGHANRVRPRNWFDE